MLNQTPDDGVRVLYELQEISTARVGHVARLEWARHREINCGQVTAHARQIASIIPKAARLEDLAKRVDKAVVRVARRFADDVLQAINGNDAREVGGAAEEL